MALSILDVLRREPATSKQIQVATGLSQTIVSRRLRDLGDSIIRLKKGRSVRYALTRNAFGGDDMLPLYMVDAHGNNAAVADIRPLAHGGFFVSPLTGYPAVLLGEGNDGVYDDLPYFLDDLRPQGFLGRYIAADLARKSSAFPPDPRDWNMNHVGRYLVSNGDDLPGNFKFGQHVHLRIRRKPIVNSIEDYPLLADNVMNGILPGSSAGGEQPKFTAFCGEKFAHVIVKFSPKGDSEIARRWRDILITEYHAAKTLHNSENPAAEVRLIDRGNRLFLESQRFDRTGEFGRLSMISLNSVDAEFIGSGSGWPQVVGGLYRKHLISWQHVYDTEVLWMFGKLINNTDMHLGNLSLAIEGSGFRLLPVYDMCSMGFSPRGGEVMPYQFTPERYKTVNLEEDLFDGVCEIARNFWNAVTQDNRISDDFRAFLEKGNPVDRIQRSV